VEDRLQRKFQQQAKAKETKNNCKGKQQGKGHKGKGKGKGYSYNNGYDKAKGQGKGKQVWQPVKGTDKGQGKNKGANNQGKGKNPMAVCYRCGQPRHLAKDCKTAVYNLSHTTYEQQHDNTAQWYYRITQTMATMPAGTTVTKQAVTRTLGNNTNSPNKHHNLR
jgi:hypothetical protein